MRTRQAYVERSGDSVESADIVHAETEQALNVVVVYQDPLTRFWAADLWDRVGQLIESADISRKFWKLSDLASAAAFADAVEAAAVADVLVISIRDGGGLPLLLHDWIDAWMPRRGGRAGALVALIGIPARPDSHSGRTQEHLQAIARQAGLDFLPRERRLPAEFHAKPTLPQMTPATDIPATWPGRGPNRVAGERLDWRTVE